MATIEGLRRAEQELIRVRNEINQEVDEATGIRQRHGSPTFYSLLQEAAETHDKKSHDYASNENPYGNYHFAGKLALLFSYSEQDAGFVGRIGEKIYRLANLESSKKTAENETIEDTEKDIFVIVGLWMADRRDRRNKMLLTNNRSPTNNTEGL